MNKCRFQRFVLFTGLAGLLLAGGLWLCLWSLQRQEVLNRRLIAALVQRDDQKALVLVNEGADPNTLFKPVKSPSYIRMWDYLLHRSPPTIDQNPTAFLIVCGAWTGETVSDWRNKPDDLKVVQAMLQDGANVNVSCEDRGWERTPLHLAMLQENDKLVAVLLDHGADANARDGRSWTPLMNAVGSHTPDRMVRLLLSHGANPNIPDQSGCTPLELAQGFKRPGVVVFLKQAGEKK